MQLGVRSVGGSREGRLGSSDWWWNWDQQYRLTLERFSGAGGDGALHGERGVQKAETVLPSSALAKPSSATRLKMAT